MASLHSALAKGCFHTACLLIDTGVDLDFQDDVGHTALMKCVHLKNRQWGLRIFTDLYDRRAKTFLRDVDGRNVLFHTVDRGRCKMVTMLMANPGVTLGERDAEGKTVLHIAAARGFCTIVRTLLAFMVRYNLDVDAVDAAGMTALMVACQHGRLQTARILVAEGEASLTMRDDVDFRNARDWLNAAYFIPDGVNPFIESVSLRKMDRITDWMAEGALLKRRRAASACGISNWRSSVDTRPGSAWVTVSPRAQSSLSSPTISDSVSSDHDVSEPMLQRIFTLYTAHVSHAYRPGAKEPEPQPEPEPEPEHDVTSEKSDKKSTGSLTPKTRMQRLHACRRVDSAILRLKSSGRRATPSPENIPLRRLIKSETVPSRLDAFSPTGHDNKAPDKPKHASEQSAKPRFLSLDPDALRISREAGHDVTSDDFSTPSPGTIHRSSRIFFGSPSPSVDHDEVFSPDDSSTG